MATPAEHIQQQAAVPAATQKVVTVDVQTLAAAFKLAYLAGLGERERLNEALSQIRETTRRTKKSLRRARPTPREGIEAALDLIDRLAAGGLDQADPREFYL